MNTAVVLVQFIAKLVILAYFLVEEEKENAMNAQMDTTLVNFMEVEFVLNVKELDIRTKCKVGQRRTQCAGRI